MLKGAITSGPSLCWSGGRAGEDGGMVPKDRLAVFLESEGVVKD